MKDRILKDFQKAVVIIRGLNSVERVSSDVPKGIAELNIYAVRLAYKQVVNTKSIVDFEGADFVRDYNNAYDAMSVHNKLSLLGGIHPDQIKNLNALVVELAHYSLNKKHKLYTSSQPIDQFIDNPGIFWCARDLKSSPIGNHHFILVVPRENMNLNEYQGDIKSVKDNKIKIITFAGFDKGLLKEETNNSTDLKSITETVCWYKPDYDLEAHKIIAYSGKYSDIYDFDQAIVNLFTSLVCNYIHNQGQNNVPKYKRAGPNCATWCNVLLESLGVIKKIRVEKGEFDGVDWGEEDGFDTKYFTTLIDTIQ